MSTIPSKICINKNRVVVLEEKCSMPTYRLCTQCPSGALLTCHRPISDAADFWYRARAPLILVASEYMSDMSGALMFQTVGVDSYVSESVDSYSSLVSATGPDSADIDVGPVR